MEGRSGGFLPCSFLAVPVCLAFIVGLSKEVLSYCFFGIRAKKLESGSWSLGFLLRDALGAGE